MECMYLIKKTTRDPQLTANRNNGIGPPLFDIAKKIKWPFPELFGEDRFLVMLGVLHIEMTL